MQSRPEPWTSEESPPNAIPAATLILLRDSLDGAAPETLMVQRATTMRFAAGALVFPGGRVDEEDRALAASLSHEFPLQDAAARIAAIRETLEEAGLAIALNGNISAEIIAAIRRDLHAGSSFADALGRHDLSLDLSALNAFARWCPRLREQEGLARIFDTRFYVARAPDDGHLATVDATENVRLRWVSAAAAIADCDAGREVVIYPTRRNLERLAIGASCDAVIAHAHAHPIEMVTPWTEERDGAPHLCIPDHLGYPITSEAKETAVRA